MRTETVTAPSGAVTTPVARDANARLDVTDSKVAEKVGAGVYALRGWGIAHTFAIEAPAGLDDGAEVWGHEHLDRNRRTSGGVNVLGGVLQSRAIAQFGVFHPMTGPDAFPNLLSFTPEKVLAVSSYQSPTRLLPDGKVVDLVIADEPVPVAAARTDTMDSVAFWFPQRRMLVTNFLVIDTIFNIYTLRGGTYRDPEILVNDARWVEPKNAEALLDIHGPTLKGAKNVREALERFVDSVQLIHDQTLRQVASGNGPREAAETACVPRNLRDDREADGQVESHVRQVCSGNPGWFDGDVYEINPLSVRGEAERTVQSAGGRARPRQRTDSANARGFYITGAPQLEGKLLMQGQPVTLDVIRRFLNTPRPDRLAGASLDQNLQFIRHLVDPRKAEGQRVAFTIATEGDPEIRQVVLRNEVLVITPATSRGASHADVMRSELANFVLGQGRRPPVAKLWRHWTACWIEAGSCRRRRPYRR